MKKHSLLVVTLIMISSIQLAAQDQQDKVVQQAECNVLNLLHTMPITSAEQTELTAALDTLKKNKLPTYDKGTLQNTGNRANIVQQGIITNTLHLPATTRSSHTNEFAILTGIINEVINIEIAGSYVSGKLQPATITFLDRIRSLIQTFAQAKQ